MTRGQIKTSVKVYGFESDLDTVIEDCINAAIRRIEGFKRWRWQETTSTSLTLTVGDKSIGTLPTDFLHPDALRIEFGNDFYDLDYAEPEDIKSRLHTDRENGVPQVWSHYGGQVIVYPRPDLAYKATLEYVSDPADLSGDSASPAMPATYHDVIKWAVVADLAARERDPQLYALAERNYTVRFKEMDAALGVKQRQSATHVVRWEGWRNLR